MRVLMLSWEYPPDVVGGLGKHVAELTPALVRAGVEIHVIAPQSPESLCDGVEPDEGDGGLWIHRVPRSDNGADIYGRAQETNQAILLQGRALLEKGLGFDLIHAHDWLVTFAGYELKHLSHIPLIATIHATELGRARGGMLYSELQRKIHGVERWLAYEAWRIITCSRYMASEVQSYLHASPQKVDVVPNGVTSFQDGRWTDADLANCPNRYAPSGRRIVFAVGRLVYEKGFHLLLGAVPRILAEFPDTQFVIAGQGPEALHLRQYAEQLGVAEHVTFPGFIGDEERDCLYHVAACAVFPSVYEPFGIVALEAMAAGCPVIVADVGGLSEVVRHGRTGLTILSDDAESVAWGVLQTLRDPGRAAARAAEARRTVRSEFGWDAIALRTKGIYQRVLDERQKVDW